MSQNAIIQDTTTVPTRQEEDEISFPAPLTPIDRALRAGKFWSAAVPGRFWGGLREERV
jgi:hypothetical protein